MYNKSALITFILLTFIALSCKISSKKDTSLTLQEYQAMGMPDPGKIWSTKDYLKAHGTLSSLRMKDPLAFPRKHSKKSSAVYNRIINKENLAYLNDNAISLQDRAFEIMNFSTFVNELSRMYTDNLTSTQYYNEELIDIYIFELFVREKMLELAGKIMSSTDPSVTSMQSGTGAVVSGYVLLVSTIMEEQVKTNVYCERDLERLGLELTRSIKAEMNWFGPADRQKLASSVRNTYDKSTSVHIKEVYGETLKLLEGTGR